MRDHSHHIQLTRQEAVRRMLAALDGLPGGFGWTGVVGAGRPAGETRPREEGPDGFFAIRFLNVAAAPDGVLEAHPVAGGPGSSAVAACNGWYMMPTGPGARRAEPGDVIMVELR